eukprot:GILK01008433.1.p1 GENE.GILK01008433.1~~GILK01008433.1.p1  ORF type:complete len:1683 (-),score=364.58 GILK01008433.1:118-5079(-)
MDSVSIPEDAELYVVPTRPSIVGTQDDEFIGVGRTAGFCIWRLQDMVATQIEASEMGVFATDSAYVILFSADSRTKSSLMHTVYVWVGQHVIQEEADAACFKAFELCEKLGGQIVTHRENQDHEQPSFLSHFREFGIEYVDSHAVIEHPVYPRFMKIDTRTRSNNTGIEFRIRAVPLSWGSLENDRCFVLEEAAMIYIWQGQNAPQANITRAAQYASKLATVKAFHKGVNNVPVVVVHHGGETDEFWTSLGGQMPAEYRHFRGRKTGARPATGSGNVGGKSTAGSGLWENQETPGAQKEPQLFRIAPPVNKMIYISVKDISLVKKDMLDAYQMFLVDSGNVIYIWIGRSVPATEKALAFKLAQTFLLKRQRPACTPIVLVPQDCEPVDFKACFPGWRDKVHSKIDFLKRQQIRDLIGGYSSAAQAIAESTDDELCLDSGANRVIKVHFIDKKGNVSPLECVENGAYVFDSRHRLIVHTEDKRNRFHLVQLWRGLQSETNLENAATILLSFLNSSNDIPENRVNSTIYESIVTEDFEPDHFLNQFRGSLVVRSSYMFLNNTRTVDLDNEPVRMYQILGYPNMTQKARQIPAEPLSLFTAGVFVVATPLVVYIWIGKNVELSSEARNKIDTLLSSSLIQYFQISTGIDSEEVLKELIILSEGDELHDFWNILGGKPKTDKLRENLIFRKPKHLPLALSSSEPRLFLIHQAGSRGGSDVNSQYEEIFHFTSADLSDDSIAVLDLFNEVFVWVGSAVSAQNQREAIDQAISFMEQHVVKDGRPSNIAITKVLAGKEPLIFKQQFSLWDKYVSRKVEKRRSIFGHNLLVNSSEIAPGSGIGSGPRGSSMLPRPSIQPRQSIFVLAPIKEINPTVKTSAAMPQPPPVPPLLSAFNMVSDTSDVSDEDVESGDESASTTNLLSVRNQVKRSSVLALTMPFIDAPLVEPITEPTPPSPTRVRSVTLSNVKVDVPQPTAAETVEDNETAKTDEPSTAAGESVQEPARPRTRSSSSPHVVLTGAATSETVSDTPSVVHQEDSTVSTKPGKRSSDAPLTGSTVSSARRSKPLSGGSWGIESTHSSGQLKDEYVKRHQELLNKWKEGGQWQDPMDHIKATRQSVRKSDEIFKLKSVSAGSMAMKRFQQLVKDHNAREFSEAEIKAVVKNLNQILAEIPERPLAGRLPINPDNMDILKEVYDGLIFKCLIDCIDPDAMRHSSITVKENMPKFAMIQNLQACIERLRCIGVDVSRVHTDHILEGRQNTILVLIWQLLVKYYGKKIDSIVNPKTSGFFWPLRYLSVAFPDTTPLNKVSFDEIVLRWFNFFLRRSRFNKPVLNLKENIQNSEAYSCLIHQLQPSIDIELTAEPSTLRRAELLLSAVRRIDGFSHHLRAEDIVEGNERLNLLFVTHLFLRFPTLNPNNDMEVLKQLCDRSLSSNSETAEKATVRAWMRTHGLYTPELEFEEDIKSGRIALLLISRIMPSIVNWSRVKRKPANRFQLVENWTYITNVAKQVGAKSPDIRVPDFAEGKWQPIKLLLAEIQEFDLSVNVLNAVIDTELLAWANAAVRQSGRSSSLTGFKDPAIRASLFLLDLLSAADTQTVDRARVSAGVTEEEMQQNAREVVVASWRLGCPTFVLPDDILHIRSKRIIALIASIRSIHNISA